MKYGWDNIDKKFYEFPKAIAVQLEPMLIRFYDSYRNGYNATKGGESGFTGEHSFDTKKRISENRRGKCIANKNVRWRGGDDRLCYGCGINKPLIYKNVLQTYCICRKIYRQKRKLRGEIC